MPWTVWPGGKGRARAIQSHYVWHRRPGHRGQYLKRAFESQMDGKGFSYVESITMCPTGRFMDPVQSLDYIDDTLAKVHPLGVVKDTGDQV